MNEPCYSVVFYGEIAPGQNITEVKKKFASLYKTNISKIEKQFFTTKAVTIKANISYQNAQKYKSAIEQTGAICSIELVEERSQQDRNKIPQENVSSNLSVSSKQYKVIFSGETLSDQNVETVKKKVAALYKVPIARCESMFSGRTVTIKDNVDYRTAEKCKKTFERIGAICTIEPIDVAIPKQTTPSSIVKPQVVSPEQSQSQTQQTQKEQRQHIESVEPEKFVSRYHKVKPQHLRKIMAMIPQHLHGQYLIGGLLYRNFSYIQIGLPIWFNLFWNYLIFTEKGIIIATCTLWNTKRPVFILYETVTRISFNPQKKFSTGRCELNISIKEADDIKIGVTKNFIQFFQTNISVIKHFAPHLVIESLVPLKENIPSSSIAGDIIDLEQDKQRKWYDNRVLVHILLVFFFPVGLYGLWKSSTIPKWWKIAASLLVLALFISVGSEDNSTTPVSPSTSQSTRSAQNRRQEQPTERQPQEPTRSTQTFEVGDVVPVGNFVYRADEILFTKSIGNDFFHEEADGIFLIIALTIKNISDESRTLDSGLFTVIDAEGKKYESSSEASTALAMLDKETLFLKQCQPNIQTSGFLAFEVPEERIYYLIVSGGFWSGEQSKIRLE